MSEDTRRDPGLYRPDLQKEGVGHNFIVQVLCLAATEVN